MPQGLKGQTCHFPPRPWVLAPSRMRAGGRWGARGGGGGGTPALLLVSLPFWVAQLRSRSTVAPGSGQTRLVALASSGALGPVGAVTLSRRSRLLLPAGQEGILRCHPDLAGRELQRGTLTAESQREQSGAGLASLGPAERRRLSELNAQYRARFGFPFVLAARLSDRSAVPRELERRLHCPPTEELRTALGEVKKIGRLRLADLLGRDPAKL